MVSDYDKKQWQAEQEARDAALEVQREKWAKARQRAARNAQRKIERLSKKLADEGKLTDWEEEFAGSVTERLDKFGSAFQDPQKGRPADALSFSQKKVVAALKKKSKTKENGDKSKSKARSSFKPKSGFKNKNFKPRVRQLEDDLDESLIDSEPYIPEISPGASKPFLRLIK